MLGMAKLARKGSKIVIPGAEDMTPEQLEKAKHNERMKRYLARKREEKKALGLSKQELRKMRSEEMIALTHKSRNLALATLEAKLNNILEDPEQFKKVDIQKLATVFGILFDKSQLAAGQATEHIAVKASVDINMNSDQAISELNRMREKFSEENSE